MARQILILASSVREGGHYAKRAGLPKFTYRTVHSPSQIKGLRSAEVHILPSFITSIARHAILAELRWAHGMEYFYVDPEDMPTLDELAADRQAENLGELTDEVLENAYVEHSGFDQRGWLISSLSELSDEELIERLQADPKSEEIPQVVEVIRAKPKRKPAAPVENYFS